MERGYLELKVFQMAYRLAFEIFDLTKSFPIDEKYSLTDQVRRSSRSVCANIAEGYRKRKYPRHFSSKMTDADGECAETQVWLRFSKDCGFISEEIKNKLYNDYAEVGRMLGSMVEHPEKFSPKAV
jgi:four helix bundle protein